MSHKSLLPPRKSHQKAKEKLPPPQQEKPNQMKQEQVLKYSSIRKRPSLRAVNPDPSSSSSSEEDMERERDVAFRNSLLSMLMCCLCCCS